MPRSFRWVPCESSSQIYGNQVRCGLFFKKNLQIEPAFAFYDNPLAQSRQLTELPAHQKAQDENWPRLRLGRIAIRFCVVAWVLDGAH